MYCLTGCGIHIPLLIPIPKDQNLLDSFVQPCEINQVDDTFRLTDCLERKMGERLVLGLPNTDLYTPIV